jgi:hypothetical protein
MNRWENDTSRENPQPPSPPPTHAAKKTPLPEALQEADVTDSTERKRPGVSNHLTQQCQEELSRLERCLLPWYPKVTKSLTDDAFCSRLCGVQGGVQRACVVYKEAVTDEHNGA